MRFLLSLLLLSLLTLNACQQRPADFEVKDADFGTWTEFVERWNHNQPGITGIGDPQQLDTEWRLARPVWSIHSPSYHVDFGYGTSLYVFVKDGRVVRFRLTNVGGADGGRFAQGIGKAVVVTGVAGRWDKPAVLRVADEINKSGLQDRTIFEGGYALNLVNDAKMGLSLDVGGK